MFMPFVKMFIFFAELAGFAGYASASGKDTTTNLTRRSTMGNSKWMTLFLLLSLAVLYGCGGGGGSSTGTGGGTSTGSGTVSVLITDDLTTEYSKAWISIIKVSAVSAGDSKEHALYDNSTGHVFNLMELSGVGSLLNTASLPAGNYNSVNITLKNEISLVTNSTGNTINTKFANSGDTYTLNAHGNFTVSNGQATSIYLDFNTKQFNYNPATNLVTAAVVFKSENDAKGSILQNNADVEGTVTSVTGSASFKVQQGGSGTILTVNLHPTVTVVNENTGAIATNTSLLQSGQRVEVYGNYDSATLTITAQRVKIEKSGSSSGSYQTVTVEGLVKSINGTIVTVDVREAKDFIPPSTITVNIANAYWSKGNISMLTVGQKIEAKGAWNGSAVNAMVVEIEGANYSGGGTGSGEGSDSNSGSDPNNSSDTYVEAGGLVQNVSGNIVKVSWTKGEHFSTTPPNPIDVDVTNAFFKNSSRSNLKPGDYIDVKGSWDNAAKVLKAAQVESEHNDNNNDNHD